VNKLSILIPLFATGCLTKAADPAPAGVADTDTDADADTDADSDSDSDVDTSDTGEEPVMTPCMRLGEWDYLTDGSTDGIYLASFDANGAIEFSYGDYDADGNNEETADFTLDAQGYVLAEDYHLDAWKGNPSSDFSTAEVNDAAGNPIRIDKDSDGDGDVDYSLEYTYDGAGRRVVVDQDNGRDGTVDYAFHWSYDADGFLTSDLIIDRSGDIISSEIYTILGPTGSSLRTVDDDGDGSPDLLSEEHYDADGNLTFYREDTDADGDDELIYSLFTYDADGNLLEQSGWFTDPAVGRVDSDATWTYDADGHDLSEVDSYTPLSAPAATDTEVVTWTCEP
jgi:hypothetical protein